MFARLVLAWVIIASVAGYDIYLTVKHGPVMPEVEMNPVGCYLMQTSGGVPLFVAIKSVGIAVAILFVFGLWQREKLRAKVLGCSCLVATMQLGLLGYLMIDFQEVEARRAIETLQTLQREEQRTLALPHRSTGPMITPAESEAVSHAPSNTGLLRDAGGSEETPTIEPLAPARTNERVVL